MVVVKVEGEINVVEAQPEEAVDVAGRRLL